jgi:hypothetical protein
MSAILFFNFNVNKYSWNVYLKLVGTKIEKSVVFSRLVGALPSKQGWWGPMNSLNVKPKA